MKVLIIGAGLGGLCLAQGLKKAGIDFEVFERSAAISDGLPGYGLHMTPQGMRAMQDCLPEHVFDKLDAVASLAGTRLQFYDEKLSLLAVNDTAELTGRRVEELERRGIGRLQLREILLTGLDEPDGGHIRWNQTFTQYQLSGGRVRAFFEDGTTAEGDVLVGADASHSRVRSQYLPQIERVDTGVLNIAGRLPLNTKRRETLAKALTDGSLNNVIGPRSDWMFAAAWNGLPRVGSSQGGSTTGEKEDYVVWAYCAATGTYPADIAKRGGPALRDYVLSRVRDWAPGLQVMVNESDVDTLAAIPLKSMPELPTWSPTQVTVLGDAIHNMTPMAGVGANTALRDAAGLAKQLSEAVAWQRAIPIAVDSYEESMRAYANPAIKLSTLNAHRAAYGSSLSRASFRTMLRLTNVFPPLKRRLFGEMLP